LKSIKLKHKLKKSSKKRLLIILILIFAVLSTSFFLFTRAPMDPFKTWRELFVGTGMTTASFRGLVQFIIPAEEVKRIMAIGDPYVKDKTTTDSINVGKIDLSGVSQSTPSPTRPLKITLLSEKAILKIQKLDIAKGGDGYIYVKEAICGISTKVKISERYNYEYFNPKRYLIEKGMDSFYVDMVQVKSKTFNGNLLIVSDPSKVSVGVTSKVGLVGEALDKIISNYKGIGGINAGGFSDSGWTGNGGNPEGLLVSHGNVISNAHQKSICGFTNKNKFVVGHYTSKELKALNLRDAVEFNPPLVVNGKPVFNYGSNAATGIHPRTAIGQRKSGEVLLLTIDGRQIESVGASLYDVQNVLLENGAYNASNLDGGHSSFMMFDNKVINKPYMNNPDKKLPSAFIIIP